MTAVASKYCLDANIGYFTDKSILYIDDVRGGRNTKHLLHQGTEAATTLLPLTMGAPFVAIIDHHQDMLHRFTNAINGPMLNERESRVILNNKIRLIDVALGYCTSPGLIIIFVNCYTPIAHNQPNRYNGPSDRKYHKAAMLQRNF